MIYSNHKMNIRESMMSKTSRNIMAKPVLILNGDYQPLSKYPLSLNTVKKVMKSLLKGRISVIKEYDDTIAIHNRRIRLPKIVVLKKYINVNHIPKFSRKNVYLRDNYTCQYCGKHFNADELTFDHVHPKCLGGRTTWDNIVTACRECNSKKGGKTLEESHMKIILSSYRYRLMSLCKQYIKQGYITPEQYDQLTEFYKIYHDLGGNGQAKEFYDKVMSL